MKKVIVIGCPGSGKTTFAEKLSRATGLPLYYLDAIWHKPDRTHIARDEFDERLREILDLDGWIIDGNYSRTLEQRLIVCDTVFFFDLPTEVCLAGATERLGKGRYDMPWIEKELSPEFIKQIEDFRDKMSPIIYNLLKKHGQNKKIVVFKSREETDSYLENMVKSNENI